MSGREWRIYGGVPPATRLAVGSGRGRGGVVEGENSLRASAVEQKAPLDQGSTFFLIWCCPSCSLPASSPGAKQGEPGQAERPIRPARGLLPAARHTAFGSERKH